MDFEQDVIPLMKKAMDKKGILFQKKRDGLYLTKCWNCGDSDDPRHRHLYLFPEGNRCNYYCHKCGAKGSITKPLLDQLIGPNNIQLSGKIVRKIAPNNPNVQVVTDIPDKKDFQYQYMKYRLGCDFTPEELNRFRIIVDQERFIQEYNIKNIKPIPDTVLFLSADGNTLCWRHMDETTEPRWYKKKVYERYQSCPYTIKSAIDILDPSPQTIVMAEGIFDILGVYKHITANANLYAAALGKRYSVVFQWLISHGIFGKNIEVQIFSDDDWPVSKIREELRKYRWMYNRIVVRYNDAAHDFGVHKDQIILRDPILI